MTRTIQFDADRLEGEQWLIVEHYRYGWSVLAKFTTRTEAERALRA